MTVSSGYTRISVRFQEGTALHANITPEECRDLVEPWFDDKFSSNSPTRWIHESVTLSLYGLEIVLANPEIRQRRTGRKKEPTIWIYVDVLDCPDVVLPYAGCLSQRETMTG